MSGRSRDRTGDEEKEGEECRDGGSATVEDGVGVHKVSGSSGTCARAHCRRVSAIGWIRALRVA
jgi:hypothetical protein